MWLVKVLLEYQVGYTHCTLEFEIKKLDTFMFMDSDHAGDKIYHRLRSGFFIWVNTTLVKWFSQKQSTVETSVFGADFVTVKHERLKVWA